ncbi:MAG: hypothetical protein LBI99_08860, partial [Propionibacteriaceae bacterium]|nr:hypothetical protein [Propionibacteriaceae bacterium]
MAMRLKSSLVGVRAGSQRVFRSALVAVLAALLTLSWGAAPAAAEDGEPPVSAPVVTLQPVDGQVVLMGTEAELSVGASGYPTPTVTWRRGPVKAKVAVNGTVLAGCQDLLVCGEVTDTARDQIYYYYAEFANSEGKAQTEVVSVEWVFPAIKTLWLPSSQAVPEGGSAVFSVEAVANLSSMPALGYQWQVSGDAGVSWGDVAGATGDVLRLDGVASSLDGSQYRVVISSAHPVTGEPVSKTSPAAVLTVLPAQTVPLTITQQPQSVIATDEITEAEFSVSVSGGVGPFSYQWSERNLSTGVWGKIMQKIEPTLSVALPATAGGYRVTVTDSLGQVVVSDEASIITEPPVSAPVVTRQPVDGQVVLMGTEAELSVAASGYPTPSVTWKRWTVKSSVEAKGTVLASCQDLLVCKE